MITSGSLSRLYQAEVEVLTDSKGRVFVVGLEAETAHPHSPRQPRDPRAALDAREAL